MERVRATFSPAVYGGEDVNNRFNRTPAKTILLGIGKRTECPSLDSGDRGFPSAITGLPPYINTKKSTKPLLHGASQKKLKRGYWVHFSLENGCTVDCIWSRAIP
jgi:hypothetical protein